MPDLTPLFFELVGPSAPRKRLTKHAFDQESDSVAASIAELDTFLTSIRPAYLSIHTRKAGRSESELQRALRYGARSESEPLSGSTTHMTDKQRDEVDYETKAAIQNITRKIRALERWEEERQTRNSAGQSGGWITSLMKDPLQEGVENTVGKHRDAVLWYLNDRLRSVSELQQSQQETRVNRQLEKSRSMMHNVRKEGGFKGANAGIKGVGAGADDEKTDFSSLGSDIAPELLQQLESEHAELLDELQGKLGKVHEAEKSLYEIAEMQNELTMHLAAQTDKIQQLMNDANQTSVDVGDANKNLESAKSRNRKASRMIIGVSLFLALLLLFYDYMMW